MILIVGTETSVALESYRAVLAHLEQLGQRVVIFKQDRCLEDGFLTFKVRGGKSEFVASIDGEEYDLDDFTTIWYDHPILPQELLRYEPVEHRRFIHKQFRTMREALWFIYRDKKWLNDPVAVYMAENKLYQASLAARAGLKMPATLITSDPSEVKAFYDEHGGNIVTKVLAVSPILDHVIYTRRILPNQIEEVEKVKYAPAIYQECVEKAYELRITIVGKRVFVAKIHSQEDEGTSVDWRAKPRLNDFEVRIEPSSLPREVEAQLLGFMKLACLRYGCIDIIVTPAGEYVFLEVNPAGQWYFVQLKTSMQIAEAIANLLVSL